jgi:molybdopterin-synthase adenylyltransferase
MPELLTSEETGRYGRHLVLKGFGGPAQQRLKAARVLIVGAGGLGSPVILYLAAAGVGTLGVVDNDRVSLSNLQRQVIHATGDIGALKTDSAGRSVQALNPHVTFASHPVRIDASNASALVAGYDLVIDGSDSIETRRASAAAAETAGIPLVSGGVSAFDGQVTVIMPGSGPRFTDLYPADLDDADLPSCELTGVLGPITGVIGTLMAMEAIKLITGVGQPLVGRLLLYDGRAATFTELAL